MHKGLEKLLRVFLIILGIYLIGDGAIHILNIRLQSVINVWPSSAIAYAKLLNAIYASFVFLVAILVLVAQSDLKKYKSLIKASIIWAIFHGLLMIYLSTTLDFMNSFSHHSSLYVWMPFYNQYLFFEAFLTIIYCLLVFLWVRQQK